MGDPKGFLKVARKDSGYRAIEERLSDYRQVETQLPDELRREQASRCMDCGVPFCHWGCTLQSKIPEWQDFIAKGDWRSASTVLHSTNIFPEFTGTVCPALCEASCVLSINNAPVTIRANEWSVVEKAFLEGYITPFVPATRSGKTVAVVGSGPAGLVVAELLNQAGHTVTVFEQADRAGGLLRYGIPDFKLEKWVIDRRIRVMEESGIVFRYNSAVGTDVSMAKLNQEFDAVCLTIGAMQPRDLPVSGRELLGVHFAMDYLTRQNKVVAGDTLAADPYLHAKDKHVVVIGGGDTGSDCVGTANRQGAKSVTQIELLFKPLERTSAANPNWPYWPNVLRTSSSHQEGCERKWALATKSINAGKNGAVNSITVVEVEWGTPAANGQRAMKEVPGSETELKADLVLLAMGFVHPVHEGLVKELGAKLDPRGNIVVDADGMTSVPSVFAAGDAVLGASLVVRAMASGKTIARAMDQYLSQSAVSKVA